MLCVSRWYTLIKKGKASKEVAPAEHCAQVDVRAKKPRELFDFKRQSYHTKLRMLGRCGFDDVHVSDPLEPVVRTRFKPEGFHIQLWITSLSKSSLM